MIRAQTVRGCPCRGKGRGAGAAVEFAFVAPILLAAMVGMWEVGRLVQIQQALSVATREGARLAAQGITINANNTPTFIHVDSGDPNVKDAVRNYLLQAGYDVPDEDLQVSFAYTTGDTSKTEPYEASKGQFFRVRATMPYTPFRWASLGFTPDDLHAEVIWASLVDDPFTIDETLPEW